MHCFCRPFHLLLEPFWPVITKLNSIFSILLLLPRMAMIIGGGQLQHCLHYLTFCLPTSSFTPDSEHSHKFDPFCTPVNLAFCFPSSFVSSLPFSSTSSDENPCLFQMERFHCGNTLGAADDFKS